MNIRAFRLALLTAIIVVITRLYLGEPFGLSLILSGFIGGLAGWLVLWAYYKLVKRPTR